MEKTIRQWLNKQTSDSVENTYTCRVYYGSEEGGTFETHIIFFTKAPGSLMYNVTIYDGVSEFYLIAVVKLSITRVLNCDEIEPNLLGLDCSSIIKSKDVHRLHSDLIDIMSQVRAVVKVEEFRKNRYKVNSVKSLKETLVHADNLLKSLPTSAD